MRPPVTLWAVTWGPQERECLIYGPYTRLEAIALAKRQMPMHSPARGHEPSAVQELSAPTLMWRPLNW